MKNSSRSSSICFVVPALNVGGSSTLLYEMICYITASGRQVDLIVFFDIIDNQYKKLLVLTNLRIHFLHKKTTIDFPFVFRLKRLIKKLSPGIISSHLTATFYLNFVVDYSKTKIFHTIHADPVNDLPSLYRLTLKRAIRLRNIRLIGVSSDVSFRAERLYGVPVKTIVNGIALPSRLTDLSERKFDFLSIGRFVQGKNVIELLQAFLAVLRERSDARLCLCGYGDQEKEIKLFCFEKKMLDNVTFFGKDQDPKLLFLDSRIYLSFSSSEGTPISLLEAMANGVAPIVSEITAHTQLVTQGENGFLFPVHDISAASQKMLFLMEHQELIKNFSNKNLEKAKRYSIGETVHSYLEFFYE